VHAVAPLSADRQCALVGGHFRHSLDIKMQFRLIQMEEAESADEECLQTYWQMAAKLRHEFAGFAGQRRMQARLVNEGMHELHSNLQIWSLPAVKGVRVEKVLKELARDIRKCEKVLSRASRDEEEEDGRETSQAEEEEQSAWENREGNEDFLDEGKPVQAKTTVKSGGLKLTISTGFSGLPSSASSFSPHLEPGGADLTDRDSVKRLMSSGMSTPSVMLAPPPPSRPTAKAKRGGKEASALDKELNSALMGFDLDEGKAEEDGGDEGHERPFQIDMSAGRKRKSRSTTSMFARGRSSLQADEEAIREVYRDDNFVYPSLNESDDDDDVPRNKVGGSYWTCKTCRQTAHVLSPLLGLQAEA
jgi:hypothetical protein